MDSNRRAFVAGLLSTPVLASAQSEPSRSGHEIDSALPVLHVPARDIPIPSSLSPAAQAMMAAQIRAGAAAIKTSAEPPPLNDAAAWRAFNAASDQAILPMIRANAGRRGHSDVQQIEAEGATIYVVTPTGIPSSDRSVFLDIHGGGFTMGAGELCRLFAMDTAGRVAARVWSVDYRMPPDHPHPAALDDCMAAYRALLRQRHPHEIIVGGGSAGGNLAAALILRARDEGLPLPAAAALLTPAVDLTNTGDTFQTNRGVDTVLGSADRDSRGVLLYAAGQDLKHPYLSPLFGDFTKGFPPTFLMSGTRDILLSSTVLMHRKLRAAGVAAELHVVEAGPHGGWPGTPEGDDLDRELRGFARAHWKKA
jgi:monoterpene epsilon-lactone hydrolase